VKRDLLVNKVGRSRSPKIGNKGFVTSFDVSGRAFFLFSWGCRSRKGEGTD
jgi:hypothetical protein